MAKARVMMSAMAAGAARARRAGPATHGGSAPKGDVFPKMAAATGLRGQVQRLIERDWFTNLVMWVIIINATVMGIDTYKAVPADYHQLFQLIDHAVTAFFVLEVGLKLFAYRLHFFRTGWNVFDLFVVSISLVPALNQFSVLRALRVVRALRLLSVVPTMRKVVEALFRALPGMGAIVAVLGLITYVGAVMATNLYGDTSPEMFGTLERSAFTLFQLMTMDGWRGEIVQPVMDAGHPYAWVFFLVFIIIGAFVILNLFIALIVDAMNEEVEEEIEQLEEGQEEIIEGQAEAQRQRDEMAEMMLMMRRELAELKAALVARTESAPVASAPAVDGPSASAPDGPDLPPTPAPAPAGRRKRT